MPFEIGLTGDSRIEASVRRLDFLVVLKLLYVHPNFLKGVLRCHFIHRIDNRSLRRLFEIMKLVSTPEQIRAGRGLLGWSQRELAEKAHVHTKTVALIEKEDDDKHAVSRAKIQKQLEAAGVVFVPEDEKIGPGVRLKKNPRKANADES